MRLLSTSFIESAILLSRPGSSNPATNYPKGNSPREAGGGVTGDGKHGETRLCQGLSLNCVQTSSSQKASLQFQFQWVGHKQRQRFRFETSSSLSDGPRLLVRTVCVPDASATRSILVLDPVLYRTLRSTRTRYHLYDSTSTRYYSVRTRVLVLT